MNYPKKTNNIKIFVAGLLGFLGLGVVNNAAQAQFDVLKPDSSQIQTGVTERNNTNNIQVPSMAVLRVADPLGEGYNNTYQTSGNGTDFVHAISLGTDTAGNLSVLLMRDPSTANTSGPTDTVQVVLERPTGGTTRYQVETKGDKLESNFKEFNAIGNPDLDWDEITNIDETDEPSIDTITCTSINNKWIIPINNFGGTSNGGSPIVTITQNSTPISFQIINNTIVIEYSAGLEGDVNINLSNHPDGSVTFSKDTIVTLQVINEVATFNAQNYTTIDSLTEVRASFPNTTNDTIYYKITPPTGSQHTLSTLTVAPGDIEHMTITKGDALEVCSVIVASTPDFNTNGCIKQLADLTIQPLVTDTTVASPEPVTTHRAKVKLFPNPTSSELNIEGEEDYPKGFNFKIANEIGQIVGVGEGHRGPISVQNLPQGIYMISISNPTKPNEPPKPGQFIVR